MIDVGLYAVTEAVGEDEKCSRVKAGSKETYVMAQNKSPFLPFGPKSPIWTEGLDARGSWVARRKGLHRDRNNHWVRLRGG